MFLSNMVFEYTIVHCNCNYMFWCGILLLQEINKNLLESGMIMIEEETSIHDVSFVTFFVMRILINE